MAPPAFTLKCLGQPELRGPDGKVVRIRVKKHMALLVYLAVERRRHHDRERLTNLLWTGVATAKGNHSMATAISALRTIFGRSSIPTNRSSIRFAPAALVLDLERLEAGRILGVEGEPDLDVDGFLRGFEIHDAPEFGLWKEREHARRLPAIHAGLLTLIDHGRRRGSHDEIMQRAERLLAIDHLAEEGIRAKMEALALVGDRFSALRVFDEWKVQLHGELEAEPSAQVEGMASQLRKRGWEPKEPNPVPAVPAEQWRDRRFVGRKQEYRQLYETWETVRQYRPQHFTISGDSGVGKTTLAQRLVTAAGLEGASVSRVQCYDMEQRIPFGTVGSLVVGLLGRPGVAATAPEALAEVARIVPQVKAHFANLPRPKQTEGEAARLLFAEGVMDLLTAVMEERPVLLVVDDIHHADEASQAVLHLVMRRIVEGRFMVAVTFRPDLVGGQQPTRFGELSRDGSVRELRLEPMPIDDCAELLGAMLAEAANQPPPSERRALVRASHGYPMALEMLAQDWVVNGPTCFGLAMHALTAEPPSSLPTAPLVDLAERQFRELTSSSRQVLSLAAIVGQRLNDLSVFSLVGLNLPQTMEGITELLARRVLRDVGNGLEFMNELVRAHVYTATPSPIRVVLHGAVADRLVGQPGPNGVAGLEVAWHLMRAHRAAEAGEYLIAGAKQAMLAGAPDEVVLALRTSHPSLLEPLRTTATLALIESLHELGYWDEGLRFSAPLEDRADTRAFRVFALEARWHLGVLGPEEQRASVAELVQIGAVDESVAGRALNLAAFMSSVIRDDTVSDIVRRAIPIDLNQSGQTKAAFLIARANLHYQARQLEEGESDLATARAILEALGANNSARARLEIGRAVFVISRGDYAAGARLSETALEIARRLDNRQLIDQAATNAALCYMRYGQYEAALRHAKTIQPDADAMQYFNASLVECNALLALGEHDEAALRLKAADRAAGRLLHPWLRQRWLLDRADVLWLLGRHRQAIAQAAEASASPFQWPLAKSSTGIYLRWATNLGERYSQAQNLDSMLASALEWRLDALDRYELLRSLSRRSVPGLTPSASIDDEITRLQSALPSAAIARLDSLFSGW